MWIYGHKTCLHGQPQTAKNGTIPFSAAKEAWDKKGDKMGFS